MNDERQTPPWLFNMLNAEFHFDTDAAATRVNTLLSRFLDQR